MSEQYIFVTSNGLYVGMDSASGGYPYFTDNLFNSHPWYSIKDAMDYWKHFQNEQWRLKKVIGLETIDVEDKPLNQ